MNYFSWLQKLRLLLVLIAATCTIAYSSSSNSADHDESTSSKTVTAITIDDAKVIPVFSNSSTSTVVYIHNNTNNPISGISYTMTENSAHLRSKLNSTALFKQSQNLANKANLCYKTQLNLLL